MKTRAQRLLILSGLILFLERRLVIQGQAITKIYLADTISNFANPERGFNTTSNPVFPSGGISTDIWEKDQASWTSQLNEALSKSNRINNGITLHSMRYHLAMFRDKDLSQGEFILMQS